MAFDIGSIRKDAELIAAVVPRDGLFTLLRRAVQVPSGWVALVVGEEGERSAVAGRGEIAATHTSEVLFVRTGLLGLGFDVGSVTSSDEYRCDASVQLAVAVSGEAADLAGFRSAVLGHADRATLSSLKDHLADEVRRGVVTWARQHTAGELVDSADPGGFLGALREATGQACFSAGLRLDEDVTATFVSSALDTVRVEAERTAARRDRMAMDRQLRQAAEAARGEHLEHVEQMLGRLRQMAEASPEVSVAELIRQFGEDQRGQLYRSLLQCAAVAKRCTSVVVAAGDELVWLDPGSPASPTRRQRVELPGGGIRSLALVRDPNGRDLLAVGGARTVVLVDPARGQVRATFEWDVPEGKAVRSGINSLAVRGAHLLASHSGLGVRGWELDTGRGFDLLAERTQGARTVRCVQTDPRGDVWVSIDEAVIRLEGSDLTTAMPRVYAGGKSRIAALHVHLDEVYAGTEAGDVVHWSADRPEVCASVHGGRGGPCQSVHLSEIMGIRRLGFADGSDAVRELVLGDTVVDGYVAEGDRFEQAWWSSDRLAGVNAYRNRVYVWAVGQTGSPVGAADIGWLCSSQVRDVCLIVSDEAGEGVV